MTSSSPPPASPTEMFCRVCAIPAPGAPPPNRWSRARARARSAAISATHDRAKLRALSGDARFAAPVHRFASPLRRRQRPTLDSARSRRASERRKPWVTIRWILRLSGVVHAPARSSRRSPGGSSPLPPPPAAAPRRRRVRQSANVDLQMAVAAASAPRDEHAALDAPAYDPMLAVQVVFGSVEREQLEGTPDKHHRSLRLAIAHPHEAQRHARDEAPVGPCQMLQVCGGPQPFQLHCRQRHVRRLHRAHRSADRILGGVVHQLGHLRDLRLAPRPSRLYGWARFRACPVRRPATMSRFGVFIALWLRGVPRTRDRLWPVDWMCAVCVKSVLAPVDEAASCPSLLISTSCERPLRPLRRRSRPRASEARRTRGPATVRCALGGLAR